MRITTVPAFVYKREPRCGCCNKFLAVGEKAIRFKRETDGPNHGWRCRKCFIEFIAKFDPELLEEKIRQELVAKKV